jgi:DNA polymerase-3 subunit delta'
VPLHPLYGHSDLQQRLATAMAAGKLPPAMLFVGAEGVGKQRLALWVAQGLLCEQGPGAPCGACQPCRMTLALSHPDAHWFFPIPRPKGDEAKQVEEAEDSLGAAIAARREQPLYAPPDGMAALFLPLVRVLHRHAQMRPAMGHRKVFIVGDAERLVPQASSPEAANAMLKVLEEPPPDTWFLLTTTEPGALLPTIRSRLVQVRVGRLRPADVAGFLRDVAGLPEAEAQRRAALAAGSIGTALGLAGGAAEERTAARELLDAARTPVARHRYALGVKPYGARGDFTGTLDAAAELLRDELERRLREVPGAAPDGDAPAEALVTAIREIERARRAAQGNVNPQLVVADLLRRLAAARA